jgi:hypothetical protein
MSAREVEVADFLRTDATLVALVPGGIYPHAWLANVRGGLSNAEVMTKVWTGGVFRTTLVIRARAAVPTGDLQSIRTQRTSTSQALEVWSYGLTAAAIEAALNRVYTLLMGKRLTAAFSAVWIGGGIGVRQAPELPPGTLVDKADYRFVFIRRPVTA